MNIDSLGNWGDDRLEADQKHIEKMNTLLGFLKENELYDIGNAGKVLVNRLSEPRSVEELKRRNIDVTDNDREYMLSKDFPGFVSDYNFERAESEQGKYQTMDNEERVAYLLSRLNVVDRMQTDKVKDILRSSYGNFDGFDDLIESKIFNKVYQEQYENTERRAREMAIKMVKEVFQNKISDDFESEDQDDTGIMVKVNSRAHQEVLRAKDDPERQKTGSLGFIGYFRRRFDDYILDKEYWELFDRTREKYWRQEAFEIMDTCFDKLTSELVDLIDRDELYKYREAFNKKRWLDSQIKPRVNKLIEKVIDKTGLTQAKNVDELKKTAIYQLAESIQFKISRDRARVAWRQRQKNGR